MRDIEAFNDLDLIHAKPFRLARPWSAGLALMLVGGLGLLAAGVLLGAYFAAN